MKTPLVSVLVLSLGFLTLVGPPSLAQGAQGAHESEAGAFEERLRALGERPALATVAVEGRVVFPDGRPAEGAVVVSSAGGLAPVDADGFFRLEVEVAPERAGLELTAVANGQEHSFTARRRIEGLVPGRTLPIGALHLTQGGGCDPDWLPTFGEQPGVGGAVLAMAVFDDGQGAKLYLGGHFTSAGGQCTDRIAAWDGHTWSPLGEGVSAPVQALAVYDDGSGPKLYAGGSFSWAGDLLVRGLAAWDGKSWSTLEQGMGGALPRVSALAVFDDGGGSKLYAGGSFSSAGGATASNVAAWDGQSWTALGQGVSSQVYALEVFDDGGGAKLYAGGAFISAGNQAANRIAAWDGLRWSALGQGLSSRVEALAVFDDGSGPKLFVGGSFTIAAWDGQGWSAVGGGVGDSVSYLVVLDDGEGAKLYAGGDFVTAGGQAAKHIAAWDGQGWSALGGGLDSSVRAIAAYDDGSGEKLYAAGQFSSADGHATRFIATWDAQGWSPFGTGISNAVHALAVYDDGSGEKLYVGGAFQGAGGQAVNRIAAWDGQGWSKLGTGMNGAVFVLAVFDDGEGQKLYAGGAFTEAGGVAASRIAAWDGQVWHALGEGVDGPIGPGIVPPTVDALVGFDDGSGNKLYVGGGFSIAGGEPANYIASWDGQSWNTLGSGVLGIFEAKVSALEVFDDGSGSKLYVGGTFLLAGGAPASAIAVWDGQGWSPVGGGMGGFPSVGVLSLEVFDDGNGQKLYAGGAFYSAGSVAANHIAAWDGSNWSALDEGLTEAFNTNLVSSLTVFDDGHGKKLYAGGTFTKAGDVTGANRIAVWDGQGWSALGQGVSNHVRSLLGFDDGGGLQLYVGGSFTISPERDSFLAAYAGCPPMGDVSWYSEPSPGPRTPNPSDPVPSSPP